MHNRVQCPALLISAPGSGHGKTSITAALARYFRRQGLVVRCFKTGPDFIDPTILTRASGNPVLNLDTWIMGEEQCRMLLFKAAIEADVILVEGVMGLFDGNPSSADLAEVLGLPLLLVVNASAMAQTFAAIIHGLATYRNSLSVAGVVANQVASAGHGKLLEAGLPDDLPLTYFMHDPLVSLPDRHLGLHLADEIEGLDAMLDKLADCVSETWLANLPAPIEFKSCASMDKGYPQLLTDKVIAVAKDRAFCFLYEENLRCLKEMGARLVFFSPLSDVYLPEADAVYLPGGYPELHAEQLSKNQQMRKDLKKHLDDGRAILAECGGMVWLMDTLVTEENRVFSMIGLLSADAVMQKKLAAIGSQYVDINSKTIRGHTFHYSTATINAPIIAQAETVSGQLGESVYQQGSLVASYLHFYFPSNPELVAQWFVPTLLEVQSLHQ